MLNKILSLAIALIAVISTPALAAPEIKEIRMWHAPDRSRIVFDLSENTPFKAFPLLNPPRMAIDLGAVKLLGKLPDPKTLGPYLQQIRLGHPHKNTTRLAFDLAKPVRYFVQMLKPAHGYEYRLVVDFYDKQQPDSSKSGSSVVPHKPAPKVKQTLLVMLDPGHGGDDPGARGRRTREKTVVLQIAKRLQQTINTLPGIRAELTRKGDYYIPLRKRIRIARQRGADLFISIHADAFRKKTARGASVYALSQRGATSESARWLANKENAADLAGGISLADKDALLAEVLLDLSITKTVSESISFGREVLAELEKIGRVHSKRVEQAAFVVLKSPDIPSILVETAYITNPTEEKLLRNSRHQKKIAQAIARGVRLYLKKNSRLFTQN